MADNRKIRNKIRGEKGRHFVLGNEDELAAASDQKRLDELKRDGVIEGDCKSTKSESPLPIEGDGEMSGNLARSVAAAGAEVSNDAGRDFQPLSV